MDFFAPPYDLPSASVTVFQGLIFTGDIAVNGTTAGTTEALKKISVSLQYLRIRALLLTGEEGLVQG
jgi:hypothetical protein